MKKLALTIALALGLTIGGFAQGGGMFQKGPSDDGNNYRDVTNSPMMPNAHGYNGDVNSQNGEPTTPIGGGLTILVGLGAAYVVAKKRREE